MSSVQYRPGGRTAQEIAASIEQGVREGGLPAGSLLPAVRALATELQVAPGTVAAAYRGLRERGLVQSDGRRGTRVRPAPPVAGRRGAALPAPPGTVDLSTGLPDPGLLPALTGLLARLPGTAASPPVPVLPRLAELGRARLDRDRVPGGPVTVASGALDAVERVLSVHLRPGDAVAVEDPGWPSLLDLVAGLGLRAVPVAVDGSGARPEALRQALQARAQAVVLTSRAQNPTGAALTPERSDALRAELERAPDTLVVEDDHAAELADVPLAVVAGTTASWAFVRSLSKPYGPDLRVALLTGDPTTVARVEGRLRLGAGWVSSLLQALAAELWSDREAGLAVDRAAVAYARRRSALLAALADRGVPATGRTGVNVWVPVPDETSAVAHLLSAGWLVAPGSRFRLSSPPGVRVSTGALPEDRTAELAGAVAAAVAVGRPPTYAG